MAPLEFRLPDVGEGTADAEIVAVARRGGRSRDEGQDLVEIQTDKAIVVIPCPAAGVVKRLGAPRRRDRSTSARCSRCSRSAKAIAATATATATGGRRAAAPADRPRLPERPAARELGIDLRGGPGQRAARTDPARGRGSPPAPVLVTLQVCGRAPTPGQIVPLRGVRRAIAHTLTRAWREIPHIIDYREVDATAPRSACAELLRERATERGDEALARALSPTPLIVRAAVLARCASTPTSTRRSTSSGARSRCTSRSTWGSPRPRRTG